MQHIYALIVKKNLKKAELISILIHLWREVGLLKLLLNSYKYTQQLQARIFNHK